MLVRRIGSLHSVGIQRVVLQTFRLAPSSVAAGAAANIAARLAERDLPVDADLLRLLRTVVWQVRVSCCRTLLNVCQMVADKMQAVYPHYEMFLISCGITATKCS